MSWTKGIWKVNQKAKHEIPFFDVFTLSIESKGLVIALCDRKNWDHKDERVANAYLMAKSPEMYSALFDALDEPEITPEWHDRVRRILTEATVEGNDDSRKDTGS